MLFDMARNLAFFDFWTLCDKDAQPGRVGKDWSSRAHAEQTVGQPALPPTLPTFFMQR